MALGDYYNVRMIGDFLGQTVENVWWFYQNTNGSVANPIPSLTTYLVGQFIQPIEAYQNENFTWNSIVVQNWKNVSEAGGSILTGEVGLVAGTPMPSWLNYTVSLQRKGAGYNYPMKRIAGVDETLTDGNDVLSATKTAIAAVFDDLFTFNTSTGANFEYLAFGKVPPIGAANPENPLYRWQFPKFVRDVRLGTQKSRKP